MFPSFRILSGGFVDTQQQFLSNASFYSAQSPSANIPEVLPPQNLWKMHVIQDIEFAEAPEGQPEAEHS